MPEQRSKQLLPIILIVAALILLVGVRYIVTNTARKDTMVTEDTPRTVEEIPRSAIHDAAAIEPVFTSDENGSLLVELWLVPGNASGNLSVMSIKGLVSASSGTVTPNSSAPNRNQEMVKDGWNIPFAQMVAEEDGVLIKMSGVYLSPDSYNLTEPLLLATMPINVSDDNAELMLTLDAVDSRLYDKQSNLLAFTAIGEAIPIKAK